jgi:hypothetical protein
VVLLRAVAGFSVAEVAQMTDRSPGSVRVLAHRGLQRVLELLAEQDLLPSRLAAGGPPIGPEADADAAQDFLTDRVTQGSLPAMDPTR